MTKRRWKRIAAIGLISAAAGGTTTARGGFDGQDDDRTFGGRRARNVIFFIGDGMGVSTVTAGRIFSVGVDGQLVLDQSRTRRCRAHIPRTRSPPTARRQ